MRTFKANQVSRTNDLRWYFLGEYSLSRLLSTREIDDQRPQERIEPVETALRSFAREALRRIQIEGGEYPGQIRLFCQKKIVDEDMKGGWGYFVIERPKDAHSQDVINFYIYEEGP